MIFLQLFITFFQIGLFGFGGGYGMLSLIQTQTVTHHAWLTSAEFTNIVAVSQMTPGVVCRPRQRYCHVGTCPPVVHHNGAYLPRIYALHGHARRSERDGWLASSRRRPYSCSRPYAYDSRKLLRSERQSVAVLDKHHNLRCHILRHKDNEDKSYKDDLLGSVRRTYAALLSLL